MDYVVASEDLPCGLTHEFANTGADDLTFLVIYDPPPVADETLEDAGATSPRVPPG